MRQMSQSNAPCPKCGSTDSSFRPKSGNWICNACDHLWRTAPEDAVPVQAARKARLFLSYGRKDGATLADRLRADLEIQGFEVWQDARRIRSGHAWEEEIKDGLRSTQVVIAVLTPHAVRVAGDPGNP